jgi:excisionase family DNA binding protein
MWAKANVCSRIVASPVQSRREMHMRDDLSWEWEIDDHRERIAELRGRSTCSVDEAARLLRIGRSTAYAAAHDGSLPTIRVSSRLLVPTAKLLAMIGVAEGE